MAFFSGWSRPPTMEEYRNGYPNFRPLNESANDNLKFYNNEIVGECVECNGEGIILECYPEEVCIDCDGTGIIYYGKENIN